MNVIEHFLDNNCDTKGTRQNYKARLNHLFKAINVNPNEYVNQIKNNKRNPNEDIMILWRNIQNFTPMTKRAILSTVNVFFEEYEIQLTNNTKKKLRRKTKGTRPVTLDVIPTNQELKQILSHGEIKAKALGLLASSSGMRLSEILQLTEEDIDFNYDPVKIYVRAETAKFGMARITFCSNEAAEAIKEWLQVRDKYLAAAVKRSTLVEKNPDDDTIFCFNKTNTTKIWTRLLRDSGFDDKDKTTGVHRMHFHTLRKFYETRMSYAGVPEAVYQQLEGHVGYLSNSYKRYTERELADAYKKGMKSLLIFESAPDLTDINKQLAEITKENETLKQEMDRIRMELLEVKLKQVQEIQREKLKNEK